MPLNVQNKEFVTLDDESKPKPILHTPTKSYPILKYILQGIFIILVVASSVFLIYIIALKQLGVGPASEEKAVVTTVDTGTIAKMEEIPPTGTPGEQPVERPAEQPPEKQPEKAVEKPVQEQTPEPAKQKPVEPIKPAVEKPLVSPEVTLTQGSFTVYIASYRTKSPADDEVSRWIEAGYEAMVVESDNHFRVALGQYVTAEDAKIFAKQMWEAFENGYWIGRVP
jgi:cell division protein FtsN